MLSIYAGHLCEQAGYSYGYYCKNAEEHKIDLVTKETEKSLSELKRDEQHFASIAYFLAITATVIFFGATYYFAYALNG